MLTAKWINVNISIKKREVISACKTRKDVSLKNFTPVVKIELLNKMANEILIDAPINAMACTNFFFNQEVFSSLSMNMRRKELRRGTKTKESNDILNPIISIIILSPKRVEEQ